MRSNAAALVIPGFTPYLATKVRRRPAASRWSAVHRLTQQLAAEFAASGVTVNAIGPSLVRTHRSAAGSAVLLRLVPQVEAPRGAPLLEDLLHTLGLLGPGHAGLLKRPTIHPPPRLLPAGRPP